MEGAYPILFSGQSVGQAQVIRRGLYYHISCRMKLTEAGIYRLEVVCNHKTENLGIPVPEGKAFVLTKILPVSRLGSGEATFRVLPKQSPTQEKFVPVNPDEPFAYLARLKGAYLQRRDGRLGIVIQEQGR